MAEKYLLEVFTKVTAPKDVKSFIKGLFDEVLHKTLQHEKSRFLSQTNKKLIKKKEERILSKSPNSRGNLKRQIREESQMDIKQREEESKEFIKRMRGEQKERERRQREREGEEKSKQEEEKKMIEKHQKELVARQEEEKNRRLRELKEKSNKRKKDIHNLIEFGNQEYKKVLSEKPLHQKIEEKYYNKILMPELERHKLELAKKREMFQPINRSAILEHARKHDHIMEIHETQKRNFSQEPGYDASKLRSKYTVAYIEDQKKKKQEIDKEALEKKTLIDKKKQYAELVLEMYQPTVDPAKKLEMQIIKEKIHEPSIRIVKKKSAKSFSAKEVNSDSENIKATKKKWKKNPMLPEPKIKRDPVKIDWLGDQRKLRDNQISEENLKDIEWDSDLPETKIKTKVQKLENEVRKQEMKLSIINPTNIKGIATAEQVNNMLIDSIRGKLAMLDKN